MTAIPHWVEWLDHGVTIRTADTFPDEHAAAYWLREHHGPDAVDDGTAWLVPAYDPDEETAC